MQRLLAAFCALICFTTAAFATNVTALQGPQDPSQLQAVVNTLIVSGNQNWNAQGNGFLSTPMMTATGAAVISFTSNTGPTGITTNIVSWLRIRGYVNNTTTPTTFYLPVWGCTATALNGC